MGTLEGVLQELRNAQAAHHAAMAEAHAEHRKHVDQVLSGILSATENCATSLALIAQRMGHMSTDMETMSADMDALSGAFATFTAEVDAKFADLVAAVQAENDGTLSPELQAKVDAFGASIQAARDHLAGLGQPIPDEPPTDGTAAGGADQLA
jgi:hypothetical protein